MTSGSIVARMLNGGSSVAARKNFVVALGSDTWECGNSFPTASMDFVALLIG